MSNKHMKKYSESLITGEIQTKTTKNYHFTLLRLVSIKKKFFLQSNAGKDAKKKELLHTAGDNVNYCSHYGKKYGHPQITKNRSTLCSSYPTSEKIAKGNKISMAKGYLHSRVYWSTAQDCQHTESI